MAFRWLEEAIDFEQCIGLNDVSMGTGPTSHMDDLSCLLNVDDGISSDGISADDFMRSLPDELGLPMLDSDILMDQDLLKATNGLPLVDDCIQDLSDSSDSGLDCGSIIVKDEPLSPASSHSSDTQLDGTTLQFMDLGNTQAPPTFSGLLPYDIKLESPPLTPEREQHIDIIDLATQATITQPTNCLKIDFAKNNTQTLHKLPPGSKIITGANGVRIIQSPITSNVTQLLNSKVKIQPKPPAPLIQPKPAVSPPATGTKPLVLTAEEFAKLTQQGLLKFQHPDDKAQILTQQPASPSPVNSSGTGEFKVAKRQQRMIKNRESACLSRKRKKEYLTTVEKQLVHYSDENSRLKEQNDQLKKRIRMLQEENQQLKSTPVGPIKKATVVFGILFFVSLNLGPITGFINSGNPTHTNIDSKSSALQQHHSRTLLSFNDNVANDTPNTPPSSPGWPATNIHSITAALKGLRNAKTGRMLPRDLMMVKRIEEMNIPIRMCPSYFNHSESERLMNELTGWVLGHKAGMKAAADAAGKVKPAQDQVKEPSRRQYRKKYAAPRKLKAAMNGRVSHENDKSQYQVQLFTAPDRDYQDFLQAIHRRNDTFYVVSFRRDHLLLPATAHNQTSRPRMSLLMPAVSTNETMDLPAGNIAMMQIDCEVMATKLLHVLKSTVPTEDAPNSNNHTATPSVDSSTDDAARRKWQQPQQQPRTKWRP